MISLRGFYFMYHFLKQANIICLEVPSNQGEGSFTIPTVSSSWDKLTPVTEEGTKLDCSSLFFLAFYKNRHKNRNGNEKAIHLRVERPCMSRRVSACLRPKTKRGEKLLLWDDQGLPIGHPGLALSEREPGEPAEPDNVIIRAGLQRNKPYLVWSRTR